MKGNSTMFLPKLTGTILLFSAAMSLAQSDDAKLATELRAKDEVLLNAVHRGDRKTWADATTDDFLYIEDGEIQSRDTFLKELEEDGSAPLIISTFEVHRIGDTAMVLHRDDVPQRPLHDYRNTHLLFSETWQKGEGTWKLRRVDITRLRIDPPPITLTPAQIDELTGTYTFAGKSCIIRRDGDRIFMDKAGQPEKEWKAETRDVLFQPGQERSRKVFSRGSDGQVTGFADRNESSEVYWKRQTSSSDKEGSTSKRNTKSHD
jgi:hypothetical protein